LMSLTVDVWAFVMTRLIAPIDSDNP